MIKNKKLKRIIRNLLIATVLSSSVLTNFNVVDIYAQTAYNPKYDYTKTFEKLPTDKDLEWYIANSQPISEETHPQYYTRDDLGGVGLDFKKLPLDGTIYRYEYLWHYDWFIKILGYECNEMVEGDVHLIYNSVVYRPQEDRLLVYGPTFDNFTDPELYNYLKSLKTNSNSSDSVNTSPTTPSTPSTPTTPSNSNTQTNNKTSITRLGGSSKASTSMKVADSFRGSSKLNGVILASESAFSDALSGSVLVKKYNAPILLVKKTASQNKSIIDYIKKNMNKNGQIVIVGSTGVIDSSVVNTLKSEGFTKIKRLAGSDKYGTNLAVVNDFKTSVGTDIIISSASNYSDALSIASVSTVKGMPIILVGSSLSKAQKDVIAKIKPKNIYITGSTGVVSSTIEKDLKKYSSSVTRLGGANRYETSNTINNKFKSVLTGSNVCLATGLDFADALVGTAIAYKLKAPVVLVNGQNTSLQKNFITKNNKTNIYVLGNTNAISDNTVKAITE